MSPGRNESGEAVAPGRVGISIGRDVHALRACCFNLRNRLGHVPPRRFACYLEMPDFHWNMRFARDANHFVERWQYGCAFTALMRSVDTTKFRRFRSKSDQLLSFRIG